MIRFDFPLWFVVPYLFAIGAALGSFLNVCAWRLPRFERVGDQLRGLWKPPSSCPRCGKRIWLRDNLPVVGWLLLRGRCRFCRRRISIRYPLVEAANGLLFVVVFLCEVPVGFNSSLADSCVFTPPPLGPQGDVSSYFLSPSMLAFWRWLYHMVLIEALVVASLIDFELKIIPDGSTLPAMAVGVLGGWAFGCLYLVPVWFQDPGTLNSFASVWGRPFSWILRGPAVPVWVAHYPHLHGLAVSLAGMLVGGGSVAIVRVIGFWVLKREAMGGGDVVLMAMIGSFLGWQPALVVFFLAPACTLVVVAAAWLVRRDREIPYGPYLSAATLILLLGWKRIWPFGERVFALGALLPIVGLFACVLMFACLQATQAFKRLLGIPDFEAQGPEEAWRPADQLFHFSGQHADEKTGWSRPQWPGVGAARGSIFENRWRHGRTER